MSIKITNADGVEIEQNWIVKKFDKNPTYPFIVVDNWYNPDEEKAVWAELELFKNMPDIQRAEDTIVAREKDGTAKGHSYRWYTNNFYHDDNYDRMPIERMLYKVRDQKFRDLIEFCAPYYRSFTVSNKNTNLISYYESNDYYDAHFDSFAWTHLVWFYKEPKAFEGGDFVLDEPGVEVKCKHNRAILFPCPYLHRVTPIKMKDETLPFGHGRWTITHFYYTEPSGDIKGNL